MIHRQWQEAPKRNKSLARSGLEIKFLLMHEMSIAVNLMELALAGAREQNLARLRSVSIQYGQISGIMPDALEMAFQILVRDTIHAGCQLKMELLPLRLRCPFCQHVFEPGANADIFQPCPACGEDFGHIVEQGRELLLTHIEAEPH